MTKKENTECQTCENCYTCESGVAKHVTREMLDKAKRNGEDHPEWFIGQQCESCVTCEKCVEAQGGCEKCFTCEKCDTNQGNCENCFTCQKCDVSQAGGSNTVGTSAQRPGESITYFVFLTNDCNLRCRYCYATKTPPTMTRETVVQTIKFLTDIEEKRLPGRNISVQFFGGEPTLKWDLLKEFVEGMNYAAKELLNKKVRWGMTTNGTLLDEERIKYLKSIGMQPLLSVDGRKETHDKYRITRGGKGSFDLIPLDTFLHYFPNCEIRPTIMPDTVGEWIKDLEWFHSKGLYTVATEVAYEADWNPKAMEAAWKTYNKMADKYIQMKKEGKKFWMKFIEDGRNFLGVDKQTGFVCGIAKNTVAIDANGYLYACQRYASFSNPDLRLGDIREGFDPEKLRLTQDFKREYMRPDPKSGFDCDECEARWRCRGGCNAMNFQCNGDRRIILENHCKFQKMWAVIALRALSATGELHKKISGGSGQSCGCRYYQAS